MFIDGNVMESTKSTARAQKAISLSSGESEFVAVDAGSSDELLIKHVWEKMTEETCEIRRAQTVQLHRQWCKDRALVEFATWTHRCSGCNT